ncbi:unnamed protein product [Absidia cylindrospora]
MGNQQHMNIIRKAINASKNLTLMEAKAIIGDINDATKSTTINNYSANNNSFSGHQSYIYFSSNQPPLTPAKQQQQLQQQQSHLLLQPSCIFWYLPKNTLVSSAINGASINSINKIPTSHRQLFGIKKSSSTNICTTYRTPLYFIYII